MTSASGADDRRAAYETALWNLSECNLPDEDKSVLAEIGDALLKGVDARPLLGTVRKPGRPIHSVTQEGELSASFWILRDAKWPVKRAADLVAQRYGITHQRVVKIARKHRESTRTYLQKWPTNTPFESTDE